MKYFRLSLIILFGITFFSCKKESEQISDGEKKLSNVTIELDNTDDVTVSNGEEEVFLSDTTAFIEIKNLLYAWNNEFDKPIFYCIPSEDEIRLNAQETAYFLVLTTLPNIKLSESDQVNNFKQYLDKKPQFDILRNKIQAQVEANGFLNLESLEVPLNDITKEIASELSVGNISGKKIITIEEEKSGVRLDPKLTELVAANNGAAEHWKVRYDIFNSHGIFLGVDVGNEDGTEFLSFNGNSQLKIIEPVTTENRIFWFFDKDQWDFFLDPFGSGLNKFGTKKTGEVEFRVLSDYHDIYVLGMKDERIAIFNSITFVINNICDLLNADASGFSEFVKETMIKPQLQSTMSKYLQDGTLDKIELCNFFLMVKSEFYDYLTTHITDAIVLNAIAREQISQRLLKQSFASFDLSLQAMDITSMIFSAFTFNNIKFDNQYDPEIPTNGLFAYYTFDGHANDSTNNGNDGVVYGATLTSDRHGNPNSAYELDGVNDYINFGDVNLPRSEFSYCIWVKDLSNSQGSAEEIIDKHSGTHDAEVILRTEVDNKIDFEVNLGNSFYDLNSTDTINNLNGIVELPLNQFTFLVVTYDGSLLKLYSNGILLHQRALSGVAFNNSNNLYIGRNSTHLYNYAHITVDDFRIYDRALSLSEIQSLYDE